MESFRKKIFNKAEEIASLDMGARNQYSSINFLGGFIEVLSMVNFLGRFLHLFLVAGKKLLKLSTMCKMQIAVVGATQLCRPNVGTIG